jgi:hypothetical protein
MEQPMCTSETEAQRKAEFALRQSRNGIQFSGRLPPKFLNIANFDTVTMTFAELGWSSKTFRVMGTTLYTDGSQQVTLSEEQSTDWADLTSSEYNSNAGGAVVALPTLSATAPSAPQNFSLTAIGNQLGFSWESPLIAPIGLQYELYAYPGSLSAANSKVLQWAGDALGKSLTFGASSPSWYQIRAVANSMASAYSPSTYGVIGTTTYTVPSSSGAWNMTVTPGSRYKLLDKTSSASIGTGLSTVYNGATPVFSWTNPNSILKIKIISPGSATCTFASSGTVNNLDYYSGTFYCNVVDGANTSSKGMTVTIERDDT